MTATAIPGGGAHKLPADLRARLIAAPKALAVWEDITPLARNEWICWVISGKKAETRPIRIGKALSKLKGGMRRPCWGRLPSSLRNALSVGKSHVRNRMQPRLRMYNTLIIFFMTNKNTLLALGAVLVVAVVGYFFFLMPPQETRCRGRGLDPAERHSLGYVCMLAAS